MRNVFLFLIIIAFCFSAKAQLFKTYYPGYYYNSAGKKVTGVISFLPYQDKIHYKTNQDASSEKISIDTIKAVVLTGEHADSLVVLTEDGKQNKSYLAKFIVATPGMRFYKKFHAVSMGGAPSMSIGTSASPGARGNQPAFHNTYTWSTSPSYSGTMSITMYQDGDTTYELTKRNFVEILSKAFADQPALLEQINYKGFRLKDVDGVLSDYKSTH